MFTRIPALSGAPVPTCGPPPATGAGVGVGGVARGCVLNGQRGFACASLSLQRLRLRPKPARRRLKGELGGGGGRRGRQESGAAGEEMGKQGQRRAAVQHQARRRQPHTILSAVGRRRRPPEETLDRKVPLRIY
eukprot:scaffold20805_cov79-Isochrysis_galbana.AAC.2